MLEAIGVGSTRCDVKLAYSSPMFDWRLVAAVRILCASSEKELQDRDLQQLGNLDMPLSSVSEVS